MIPDYLVGEGRLNPVITVLRRNGKRRQKRGRMVAVTRPQATGHLEPPEAARGRDASPRGPPRPPGCAGSFVADEGPPEL